MNICHKCKKEIAEDFFVGRQSQCPSCGTDLHCCLNCSFYELGAYNDCREPQAERVLDKSITISVIFSNLNKQEKLSAG